MIRPLTVLFQCVFLVLMVITSMQVIILVNKILIIAIHKMPLSVPIVPMDTIGMVPNVLPLTSTTVKRVPPLHVLPVITSHSKSMSKEYVPKELSTTASNTHKIMPTFV